MFRDLAILTKCYTKANIFIQYLISEIRYYTTKGILYSIMSIGAGADPDL